MKKVLILFFMFLLVVGCNLSNTPSSKVEMYLDGLNNLNDDVILDIESKVSTENLTNDNKELYKEALKRQYQDLKYEVKEESINGDDAFVIAKISVYDFHKEEINSVNYMNEHTDEFSDVTGVFDNSLFNTYRLNKLNETKNKIDYEVKFELNKKNGEWVLQNPEKEVLEKINGFYDYDNN